MKFAIPAALAVLLAAPLAAQDQPAATYDREAIVKSVDGDLLAAIAGGIGGGAFTVIRQYEDSPTVLIENQDGYRMLLSGNNCLDEAGTGECTGIIMQMSMSDSEGIIDPETVAAYNRNFYPTKVFLDEEGSFWMERYLVLAHGMTQENLGFNIFIVYSSWDKALPYVLGEKERDF